MGLPMATATIVSQKSNGESQMTFRTQSWQTPLTEQERYKIRRMLKILEVEKEAEREETQRQARRLDKSQGQAPIGQSLIRTQGRTYASLEELFATEFPDCL